MEINVRNARRIDKQLQHLCEQPIDTMVSFSIFDDAEPTLVGCYELIRNQLELQVVYNATRFAIRDAISDYNRSSGLNSLMLQEQVINGNISMYGMLANSAVSRDTNLVEELKSVKARYENSSPERFNMPQSQLIVPVLKEAEIEEFNKMLVVLNKRKAQLADKMLGLNIAGTITIPPEYEQVLVDLNFL